MGSLTDFKKRHGIPVYEKEEASASSKTEKPNSLTNFLKRNGAIDYQERARQKQMDTVDRIRAQASPFLKTPQTAAEKSFDAIGKALGNANWAQQKAVHEQRMALIAEGQKAREEAEGLTAQIQEAKKQAGKDRQSFYGPATTYGGQGQVVPQKVPEHHGLKAPEIYQGSGADKAVEELEKKQRELKLKYWSSLFLDPEFDEKSTYVPGMDHVEYKLVNRDPNAVAAQDVLDQKLISVGLDKQYYQYLKPDEIALYNYVYATQGKDAATDFMDTMRPSLYARQRGDWEEDARRTAKEYPMISSAFSVLTSPMKGIGYLGQTVDFLADGSIDQNAPWNRYSHMGSAIRDQVGGSMGDVGNFFYQTGMSLGDFATSLAVGGPTGSLYLMGTGAAADTVIEAKDRGLSDSQAYALGTVAGAAEVVMEKIGMDALFDTKALQNKGWLGYLLKNALAEGGEEVGTDVINTLADIIISKDKSYWQMAVDAYIDAGKTEGQAFGLAVWDKVKETFGSFVGGAMSGGFLGGIGSVSNKVQITQIGRQLDAMKLSDQQIRQIIRQELDLPSDSRAYQLALKMLDTLNAGKQVSGSQIAEMLVAGQEYLDAQAEDAELPEGDGQNEGGVAVPPSAEGDTPTVNNADSPLREGAEDTEEVGGDRHVADAPREDTVSGDRHVDDAPREDTVSWDRRVDDVTGEGSVSARDINDRIGEDRNDDGPAWVSLPVVEQEGAYDGEGTGPQFTEGGRDAGAGVSDGGSQWDAGSGAGEQTGRMGSGPAWRGTQDPGGRKAEVARQSHFSDLRLPKVSSLELGLQSGTEARVTREVTDEYWDDEMQDLAVRIYEETGKEVRFVLGPIQIRNVDGVVRNSRGVYTGEQIIVQADNYRVGMEKLADHEAFHAKNDASGGLLLHEVRQYIMERFTEEEYRQVVDQYIDALYGVYDLTGDMDGEALEEAMKLIEEEVFADAYAGINAFGAGADRFGEAVNERMDQLWMGKKRAQDNGTAEPTGPPAERFSIGEIDGVKRVKERFSYAGEQAQTADLDALERAKEMQAAGVAEETIRQETGWFVGMDGKWRWEIDDSATKYHRAGDALFSQIHPEYARHQELMQKFLHDEITTEEHVEFRELHEIWDRENQRLKDRVKRGNAQLQNIIRHDALFEAYPQLRGVRVIFGDMPDGTRGNFDTVRNRITLNNKLDDPMGTLIHEIQHVIQNIEGFASGASTEYWEGQEVWKGEYASEVKAAENAMKEVEARFRQEWDDDINLDLMKRYIDLDAQYWGDGTDHLALQELADQMGQIEQAATDGGWDDLFNDYYYAAGQLQMARERAKLNRRTSIDLYRNTAGEIEARDSASRRTLTSEGRKAQAPDLGDPGTTVFVEDGDGRGERVSYSVDDTDSEGRDLSEEQQEYFKDSVVRDRDGRLLVVYHQTDADFTIFETRRPGAGSNDSETPFGIFLKRSSEDIGLAGKKQMALYANITNPLRVSNREELVRQLRYLSRDYAEISDRFLDMDREYQSRIDDAKKAWSDYVAKWRAEHPNSGRRDIYDDPKFNELDDVEDDLIDEWTAADARLSEQAKHTITEALRRAGYDGIILANDTGSWGRRTDAIIALDPDQVKNVDNRKPTKHPDIRYSVDDAEDRGHTLSKVEREAVRLFGTTSSFDEAGYILRDGSLLRFTDDKNPGTRNYDHRAIAMAYGKDVDLEKNHGFAMDNGSYLDQFVEAGNIRIDVGDPDLDMDMGLQFSGSVPLTKAQEMTIRDLVAYKETRDETFEAEAGEYSLYSGPLALRIDFGGDSEYAVGSVSIKDLAAWGKKGLEYNGKRINASQVLHDVRHFYETGETVERSNLTRFRYSADDGETEAQGKQEQKKEKPKPVAESRPIRAKRELRQTLMGLFSIPEGSRVELWEMIDSYADRLIKNGGITEEDRRTFFDRMYEAGVMVAPADDYFAGARNYIEGGKIYVPDSVVAEFGDDWADIRRRAFCAGVYLTRSDISKGHRVSGIDGWNTDLSMELPGLFDSEDTDLKSILERIVQVAEEGKAERLSLPEYTKRLAEQGEVSEDEFLDHMERQMDWALRTFAEKAELEVYLRDRTGVKIAQERGRYDARTAARKAQESQRRAKERQERKDMAQRAKDRRELAELQKKTLKQLQWLAKNRNRAPEDLRAVWDEVLGDIDLYAVGAANEMLWSDRYNATWRDIAQMYKDARENDPNFMPSKDLERIIARLDGKKIGDMDLGALQDLYRAAIGLRTEYYNRRNVINDDMHRLFSEVYTDSKHEIEAAPGGYSGKGLDKLFNLEQLTPMNVLERMGGWDPDGAFYSMAKQLEQGERDQRAYTVKAQKMLQQFLEEHEDFVKKADGQGKDAVWYEVAVPELLELHMGDKPIFGDTVTVYMTPAQKIHMYLESKNVDNLRHMTGGRTFVDKELYSQGKRQEALAQGRTIRLAPETVRALVSDLTPEEMELATLLERYYNGFATGEINRVSNVLYGYDKAMGDHYAPIYTNQNYTNSEFGVFDVTAEGVGNLKERKHAKNPSYNISCFDAFERHVDRTARFVGMAIPTRNWQQLMNWRTHDNSTADVISHKWGDESVKYIDDLITMLQGGTVGESDAVSSWVGKLQSNYISAVFGANPSIVLKQLGSIPLAGAYLGAGNIPRPGQLMNIDRELIGKYTQELEWRTMGYTTPETKFLKDNPNWTQTNKTVRFVFGGGAITAMDGWAASTLWPWAENKVRKEFPELEVGTQEQVDRGESPFYRKVAEEFNNAVSRSQSVSDEIHQSSLRKSKNPVTRAFTLFRSDSAQTYNALRQLIGEARYQKQNGADDKAVRAAKGAVGAAFMAMMINAMWGEAINFLMALWKNKGKKYRDDEEELTTESVIGEMVSNMMGSMAGVVAGGEELFELIGNILTGDKWYGIDTPGMEQLNDLTDVIVESGKDIRELISGGWDVVKQGGDLGAYFSDESEIILSTIKSMASTVAQYLGGVPANNVEAYLVGALKWVSPELGTAYDDLFDEVNRADLAKTEDGAVADRVGRILDEVGVAHSQETVDALAELYGEGHTTAVPSDTPASISVNGEDRKLGAYQQQTYGAVWRSVVSGALDELVASKAFAEADSKTRKRMLESLYNYAKEQAKDVLFDDYELDASTMKNAEIISAGVSVADIMAWNVSTSDMKGWEKAKELLSWDLPGIAKRAIFRNKISDTREDAIGTLMKEGISFDRFLSAYSTYGRINAEDVSAGEKATAFAHWLDTQGFTKDQTDAMKDELAFYMMAPAEAGRYDKFVDAGLDADEALGLDSVLGGLEPEQGKATVANIQKWRACVDYFDDKDDQMTALFAVMTESQYQKVEVADEFGVSPDTYVSLQEILPDYDADGNGAYKQAEIQNAIEALGGQYSAEQKAVLWQLATGSNSSKKNPYSQAVGQQVIDAKSARKSQSDGDDESFSDAVMGQLMG